MISIHTDGGCRHNPGLGAWAFVVSDAYDIIETQSASKPHTTNNEMELTAILKALNVARSYCCLVTIYSDSQYAIKTITEWAPKWKAANTLHSHKNSELIENILSLYDKVRNRVDFEWVKAHSTNPYNNLADRLVNQSMDAAAVTTPSAITLA